MKALAHLIFPDSPGSVSIVPDFVEVLILAISVHREKESRMFVRTQLPVFRHPSQSFLFKNRGVVKLVAANDAYPEIVIQPDNELIVWGVVTDVIHGFRKPDRTDRRQ